MMRCHEPILSAVASRPTMRPLSSPLDPPSSIRNRPSTLVLSLALSLEGLEGIDNPPRPSVPSSLPIRLFGVSPVPSVAPWLRSFVPSAQCHNMALTKKLYSQNEPI